MKTFSFLPPGSHFRELRLLAILFNLGWITGLNLWQSFSCSAQTVYQFDSPGTQNWTIPPGTTRIDVEAWGGGGNGVPVNLLSQTVGNAGNGGDYVFTTLNFSPDYQNLTITVGNAGAASGVVAGGESYSAAGGRSDGLPQVMPPFQPDRIYRIGGKGGSGIKFSTLFGGIYAGGGGGGSAQKNQDGEDGENASYGSSGRVFGLGGNGEGKGGTGGYGYEQHAQNGFAPGGGGSSGGNLEDFGLGANGRVKLTVYCDPLDPGMIGQSHTIVNPQERVPDYIFNVSSASGSWGNLSYSWEQSPDGLGNWNSMEGESGFGLLIPPLTSPTFFRRKVVGCGPATYSNVVRINVLSRNGTISGFVRSLGGVGVQGIRIQITKKTSLPGSPQNYLYTDTTNSDGYYSIPVYYGDPGENNGSVSTQFKIIAFKPGHVFTNDSLQRTLTNTLFNVSQVDFVDETAYSITGNVVQKCVGCLTASNTPATIISNLDGVNMYSKGKFQMTTRFLESTSAYGSWAITVLNQGNISIRPQLNGRGFVPDSTLVNVIGNLAGISFEDTTTHWITGKIGDGCKIKTGEALLEFKDVLLDKNGRLRTSEFRKRVQTVNGQYAIKLPARKYQVSVVSYVNDNGNGPLNIEPADFLAFFNTNSDSGLVKTALPYDSLLVDISSGNRELNLFYQRSPELELVNLDNAICNSAFLAFTIFPQSLPNPYQVKVWQGPKSLNCALSDDSVIVNTTVQNDDENERRALKVLNGVVNDTLIGGVPKIVGNFFKTFSASYQDRFGRSALTLEKNAVVTGVKADNASSFATTSPQVPIMVLHDPPGDQSSSYWETSQAFERAMRWNVAAGNSTEGWLQVKLGTQFDAGLGVTTSTEIWGQVNSSINVSSRTNKAEESIITTTTTQNISTSADEDVTGDRGDLFIGAAINLLYTRAFEVKLNGQCFLEAPKRLMIAQNGFGTQYVYTDAAIRDNVIPTLKGFANNPGMSVEERNGYLNQVKVWEQVLANNEENKRRAPFDKNISFFGSSGAITNSTTTASTKSSSIEFDMEIDAGIAAELGFEIAGSGVSGGVNVHFKTEMGQSTTNTSTKTTTIGYTLDDNDALDNFSVNIRRDPVYNTPVFQTVAGQSSCPAEDHTLARDDMYFQINNPEVSVGANEDAVFNFELGNLSVDVNPRTYNLTFDQASNPYGASISIGGIPMGFSPIPYSIDQLDVVNVTVNVKRNLASNTYTYEGLHFYLSDACTGEVYKTGTVTARFQAPCSPVVLVGPQENWLCNSSDNQTVPVQFNNYQISSLQQIAMEFCKVGSNNWRTGFIRNANELGSGPNGTLVNWNVTAIADGSYYIRLKLTCASGIIYSERVMGTIDRTAPSIFGVAQPNDGIYSLGDELSFTYNEALDISSLNSGLAQLKRTGTGTFIPVTVSGFQNKLLVLPRSSLTAYEGETLRLFVSGVSDAQGNVKLAPDSLDFVVGSFQPAGGNNAVQISLSPTVLQEGETGNFAFRFALPVNATNDVQVNFSVSGTASFGDDYSVGFSNSNGLNTFSGTQGMAIIPRNQSSVTIRITPLTDSKSEGDETLILSISEGGDYLIGATHSEVATIRNVGLQPPVISGPSQFCEGGSATLTVSHPDLLNPDVEFVWSNGQTGTSISVSQGGLYSCTITNTSTQLSGTSVPFEIIQNSLPSTNAGPDFSIIQNTGSQMLSGFPAGGIWSGPGMVGTSFSSTIAPGTYEISYCVTSSSGCTRCDTLKATVLETPTQVATPVISPGTGTHSGTQTVVISSATAGSTIYYTTSGNNPVIGTSFTRIYTGPFQISESATVRAMAVKSGLTNSGIAAAFITIINPSVVATPVISPGTGTYSAPITVTISCPTPDAVIYYTTSGNIPVIGTSFTRVYIGPFQVSSSATIRAMAIKTGFANSGVGVAFLSVTGPNQNEPTVAAPVISPGSGIFSSQQVISITCSTPGATIYYTTNGNVPRLDVANYFTKVYSGPFQLANSATIRAVAILPGSQNSSVSVAYITIAPARQAVEAEKEKEMDIQVSPNPSQGLFRVMGNGFRIEKTQIQVLNVAGQVIWEKEINQGLRAEEIDLSSQVNGLYFLKIRQNNFLRTIRLLKQ